MANNWSLKNKSLGSSRDTSSPQLPACLLVYYGRRNISGIRPGSLISASANPLFSRTERLRINEYGCIIFLKYRDYYTSLLSRLGCPRVQGQKALDVIERPYHRSVSSPTQLDSQLKDTTYRG